MKKWYTVFKRYTEFDRKVLALRDQPYLRTLKSIAKIYKLINCKFYKLSAGVKLDLRVCELNISSHYFSETTYDSSKLILRRFFAKEVVYYSKFYKCLIHPL